MAQKEKTALIKEIVTPKQCYD